MKFPILLVVMGLAILGTKPSNAAPKQLTSRDTNALQPPTINLKPMFDYLAAVMDTYGMRDFITDKLENDSSGQEIRDFLRGSDGVAINNAFWRDLEFANFINWMYDNGLANLYNEINSLHTYFGWELVGPSRNTQSRSIKGRHDTKSHLKSLLVEFMANYEYDLERGFKTYIQMLMSGDTNALALFYRMSDPAMGRSWASFKTVPEVQNMFQSLREEDIDIDRFILAIETLLGWRRY